MAKTTNKVVSTRVSPETEQFLAKQYGTASAGLAICAEEMHRAKKNGFEPTEVSELLQNLEQIRLYSTRELKGKFTQDEWCYLADCLNGTMITPQFRANVGGLIASVEDSNDFDGLGAKWKVNVSDFVAKIKTLTGAQVDAVFTRIEQFWSNNNGKELKEWASEL